MPEIEIRTREDLPRVMDSKQLTIGVRLAVVRNLWSGWCLALSAEYGQPVEGFDSTKAYVEGPNPFRLSPSALHHMMPGPYPIVTVPSFDWLLDWTGTHGYSLWAIWPGEVSDVEFEIRRERGGA